MKEYLDKVASQIRCKKAWPFIENEIKMHIEDQIEDNKEAGMTEDEAIKAAIEDMGDPIETGIKLDSVHRPELAWKMVLLVGIISAIGILIHGLICLQAGSEAWNTSQSLHNSANYYVSIIIGSVVMFAVYKMDYTVIAEYAKPAGVFMLAVILISSFVSPRVNGFLYYVGIGSLRVALSAFMMFYVPVFGGLLYQLRGDEKINIVWALLLLIIPVLISMRIPNPMLAGIMYITLLCELSYAVSKGWFAVKKIPVNVGLWSVSFLALSGSICGILFLPSVPEYQAARIRAIFDHNQESNYIGNTLRSYLSEAQMIGSSEKNILNDIPDCNSDYILAYVMNHFGILAGIGIIAILAILIVWIIGISIRQKNQLGNIMGFGCGMLLCMNLLMNAGITLGLIPDTSSFMPFFSAGRSNIILSYAITGIILSIYKYQNVYTANVRVTKKDRETA